MKRSLILISTTLIFLAFSNILQAQDISGTWYNTEKSGKIKIFKEGNAYFGEIVWLEEPNDEYGKPKVNENAPDASDQKKPIIGLRVVRDLTADGDGKVSGGTIDDPENGKTYKCVITFVSDNKLDVRGYVGIPALGRTENWTRASE